MPGRNKRNTRFLLISLALVIGLGGFRVAVGSLRLGFPGLDVSLASQAMANAVAMTKTLDRELEPVIISGAAVSDFIGLPVDELLVYAYTDGAFRQIPVQVDEVDTAGSYIANEDAVTVAVPINEVVRYHIRIGLASIP